MTGLGRWNGRAGGKEEEVGRCRKLCGQKNGGKMILKEKLNGQIKGEEGARSESTMRDGSERGPNGTDASQSPNPPPDSTYLRLRRWLARSARGGVVSQCHNFARGRRARTRALSTRTRTADDTGPYPNDGDGGVAAAETSFSAQVRKARPAEVIMKKARENEEMEEEGNATPYGTWSREGCGPSCDTMWRSANATWKMGEEGRRGQRRWAVDDVEKMWKRDTTRHGRCAEDAASWWRDTTKNGDGDSVEAATATTRQGSGATRSGRPTRSAPEQRGCVVPHVSPLPAHISQKTNRRKKKKNAPASPLAAALNSAGQNRPLGRALEIEVSTCGEEEEGREEEERHRAERSERAEDQGVSGAEEGVTEVAKEGNASRGGRRERDCAEEGEEKRGRGIGVAQRSERAEKERRGKVSARERSKPVRSAETRDAKLVWEWRSSRPSRPL
ncbi:hypothetical protein C8R44DRAFT_947288 [Mycena epipterygia]|nr:hypothetical protein C8R44DRAFT_947288 [Mycena epipterygia]